MLLQFVLKDRTKSKDAVIKICPVSIIILISLKKCFFKLSMKKNTLN